MFAFLDDVNEGIDSTIQITVFSKQGKSTTSELHFINKDKTVFTNNEKSYGMPTGKIECMNIQEGNESLQLDGCKGDLSTILAIKYNIREYVLASKDYKKTSKK